MLSKDQFVQIMHKLQESDDATAAINKVMREYSSLKETRDFFDAAAFIVTNRQIIDELLEECMIDNGEWISYWVYELNYGREWSEGCVQDKNGNDIPLGTAEQLYEFLLAELVGNPGGTDTENDD